MWNAGLIALVAGYMLSQFYRAMLAVLAPVLDGEIGASAEDLATASGLWFLTFALMQIPIGEALDRIGPRRTTGILFLFGGAGGALVFALAQQPWHINAAMILIGIGCSPVLMASYFIFARNYPAAVFATMGAIVIGVGSVGNILSSIPMTWTVEAIGWRATLGALAVLSAAIAVAVWVLVQDPERVDNASGGSVLDVLRIPALWLILPMMLVNYAPAAGLRGLWAGPYASDVFQAGPNTIGLVTLIMSLAMVAGNFAYGPLDRLFGTRKWVVLVGNGLGGLALLALWLLPDRNLWLSTGLLAVIGFAGASFPVLIAHGRSLFPAHLTGRGVTLMNLFGISGVGLTQMATGRIHTNMGEGLLAYQGIFGFMLLTVAIGLLIYLFSQDRTD